MDDKGKEIAKDRIERFIVDNGIVFTGTDSDLNSNCVILSGFALYCGVDNWYDVVEILGSKVPTHEAMIELNRVYLYADSNNYGKFWDTKAASDMYTF